MKTIQIICWLLDKAARAQDHSYARMLNLTARRLKELEEKQRWIPVEERLPDAHESCIVYRKGTFGHYSMLRYSPELGFHFYDSEWGDVTVDDVTHWMPLPEPPEEVE